MTTINNEYYSSLKEQINNINSQTDQRTVTTLKDKLSMLNIHPENPNIEQVRDIIRLAESKGI